MTNDTKKSNLEGAYITTQSNPNDVNETTQRRCERLDSNVSALTIAREADRTETSK